MLLTNARARLGLVTVVKGLVSQLLADCPGVATNVYTGDNYRGNAISVPLITTEDGFSNTFSKIQLYAHSAVLWSGAHMDRVYI